MIKVVQRRNSLCLTKYGWVLVISLLLLTGILLVRNVHDFLELQRPVSSTAIVVLGTLPDSALESIVQQLAEESSTIILTAGGPISRGSHLSSYRDYATLAAATLNKIAPPGTRIVAVPANKTKRDRVYESALALRDWQRRHASHISAINVYSLGVRSRRTKSIFDAAFGDEVEVGIVPVDDPSYDASVWWTTSQGFRTVTDESIAYLYAKLFFWP